MKINKLHKNFDVILIDSILRDVCTVEAIKHLKKGGIIILDDAQRYLPYGSKVPETIYFGPTPSKKWGEFIRATSKWKTLYFSNGVWDTAIFIKP